MKAITVIKSLGPTDLRSVQRDSLLSWMVGAPVFISLVLRFLVPEISKLLWAELEFDLVPYYPMIVGYYFIMIPVIFGLIIGFLLLDERDDHTLTALQVTPLSMNNYLLYRISIPVILSVVLTIICFPITGLVSYTWPPVLLAAVMSAILAPVIALVLAAFASNKVTGFAVMKGMSGILLLPLAAYLIGNPWHLFFGILPTYWPVKVYWLASEGATSWHYFLAGALYELLCLWALLKRFNRVIYQ